VHGHRGDCRRQRTLRQPDLPLAADRHAELRSSSRFRGNLEHMTGVTPRLFRRIVHDFPQPGSAQEISRLLAQASDSERVQAAILLWGSGDLERLRDAIQLAGVDWRDALMRADLAKDDWRDRLNSELGP
jgi:hypothetical protein